MNRKDDHIKLAQALPKPQNNDFDKLRFIHHGLPSINLDDVDYSTSFDGIDCELPFFINAMTGGSEWTKSINTKLAHVAQATGLMMASGSMSAAFKDESTLDSFLVIRKENPKGIVLANLQASATLKQANQAVLWLQASGLQLHVNVAQELLMPEGDRNFKGWLENIQNLVKHVEVPIIVKEVGFGFSQESIQQLVDLGVKNIDISGRGGTNFASIENSRSDNPMNYMSTWGQSTVQSLLEAQAYTSQINIMASGGIRNMLDVAKALALGAKAVGISGTILNLLLDFGVEETIDIINQYKVQLKKIMTLLGVKTIDDFQNTDLVFDSSIESYAHQRGLDLSRYNKRKNKQ